MPEELVIVKEVSELIVEAPIEAEFIVHEPPTVELLEVIEQGPPGRDGAKSILSWIGI